MAYQVNYERNRTVRNVPERHKLLLPMTLLSLFAFLTLVSVFWPDGRIILWNLLIPGDAEWLACALEGFAAGLRQDMDFSFALETFIQEIRQYANNLY